MSPEPMKAFDELFAVHRARSRARSHERYSGCWKAYAEHLEALLSGDFTHAPVSRPVRLKPGRCADCGDGVDVPRDSEGPIPCPHDCESA